MSEVGNYLLLAAVSIPDANFAFLKVEKHLEVPVVVQFTDTINLSCSVT